MDAYLLKGLHTFVPLCRVTRVVHIEGSNTDLGEGL